MNHKQNILIIESSTRDQGGTQKHIEALMSMHPDVQFEQITLRHFGLKPFIDHRKDGDWSFAKEALPLLEKMLRSDLIILATPLYWFSMSHLMKNFMDYWTYFMRAGLTPDRYFLSQKKVMTLIVASHLKDIQWAQGSLRSSVEFVHGNVVFEFIGLADREGIADESTLKNIRSINIKSLCEEPI